MSLGEINLISHCKLQINNSFTTKKVPALTSVVKQGL